MTAKAPPVPPENQSHQGTGDADSLRARSESAGNTPPDPDKQGQQGNSKENTTHQGYQQDR